MEKTKGLVLTHKTPCRLYRHINLFSLPFFSLSLSFEVLHYLFKVVFFRTLKIFLILGKIHISQIQPRTPAWPASRQPFS